MLKQKQVPEDQQAFIENRHIISILQLIKHALNMKSVQVSRHKKKNLKLTSVLIIIINFLKKNVSEIN